MEDIHNWINTAMLVILGIAFFTQNNILKYMRTAMETINPEKIKQSQDFIEEGRTHEFRLILSKKIKELNKSSGDRFQEIHKDFIAQYEELLNIPFSIMRDKDWQYRERHLLNYPRNAETLRSLLDAYDKDELPAQPETEN